jgi:hypothetical protein
MTEYLAENSRLRQLSRRYSEGQIAYGEYRAARREIIEALEAGEVQTSAAPLHDEPLADAVTQPPHPVEDDAVFLKTMPPRATLDEPVPAAAAVVAAPAGWDNHTRILAAVLGLLALLALAGLVYVMVL